MHSNPFLPALGYDLGAFLRSDFLEYLAETLPAGVLNLEHELTDIDHNLEEVDDGKMVRVTFANGEKYYARLVIGCDGSKSRVRSLMMQQLKPIGCKRNIPSSTALLSKSDPFYVDINVWWCVTKFSDIPVMERTQWDNGPSRLYFEGGAIMHIVANDRLILSVDYRAPSLRRHHKNWTANSTGADLLKFMKVWGVPSKYWPAAKYASRVAQFAIPKGLGSEEAALWHNSTNVVLLGDAVHPTPHFFGQGANAAIQDAYCLVRCLCTVHSDDGGDLSSAFSEYVKIRKPPADDIISKSYLLGLIETAGGLARLARDLIFFTVLKTGLFIWAAVDINTVRV
jgi:2-polyprenyl-6-methoxyphenol hydroxylase-like FAD-dependent oxidoreductase